MQEIKVQSYEELDKLVAAAIGKDLTPIAHEKHVFDYENFPDHPCHNCYLTEAMAEGKPCIEDVVLPQYSKYTNAAMTALETFPRWEITKLKNDYNVLFYEMRELTNATRRNDLTSARGETLPLAICYAILQFKGLMVVD